MPTRKYVIMLDSEVAADPDVCPVAAEAENLETLNGVRELNRRVLTRYSRINCHCERIVTGIEYRITSDNGREIGAIYGINCLENNGE